MPLNLLPFKPLSYETFGALGNLIWGFQICLGGFQQVVHLNNKPSNLMVYTTHFWFMGVYGLVYILVISAKFGIRLGQNSKRIDGFGTNKSFIDPLVHLRLRYQLLIHAGREMEVSVLSLSSKSSDHELAY